MVEIIFQSKHDAMRLHSHLLLQLKNLDDIENILLLEDRYIVKILAPQSLETTKKALYDFIVDIKRNDWFRDILQGKFFYYDQEEQEHILELIHSILDGSREDLASFIKLTDGEAEMKDSIESMFNDQTSFSFDSFVKFRLKAYLQLLEEYVSVAIDEYKLEQEYQSFIQTLRDFLVERVAKIKELHVVFDEDIAFYDQFLNKIRRQDLIKMIDRRLLVNHPVYVDSVSIAPLLSIAPERIFLYCCDMDIPLIRTIQNIFEERIVLNTVDKFVNVLDFSK